MDLLETVEFDLGEEVIDFGESVAQHVMKAPGWPDLENKFGEGAIDVVEETSKFRNQVIKCVLLMVRPDY